MTIARIVMTHFRTLVATTKVQQKRAPPKARKTKSR